MNEILFLSQAFSKRKKERMIALRRKCCYKEKGVCSSAAQILHCRMQDRTNLSFKNNYICSQEITHYFVALHISHQLLQAVYIISMLVSSDLYVVKNGGLPQIIHSRYKNVQILRIMIFFFFLVELNDLYVTDFKQLKIVPSIHLQHLQLHIAISNFVRTKLSVSPILLGQS